MMRGKYRASYCNRFPAFGRETARTLLIECPELGKGDAVRVAVHFTKANNVFKRMFERLRLAGKSYKLAVIAAAHKMLKIAHALLKSETKWENKLTG